MTKKRESNKSEVDIDKLAIKAASDLTPASFKSFPDIDVRNLLLEHSPNAVFTINSAGYCTFQNLAAQALLYSASHNNPQIPLLFPEIDLNRVLGLIKEGGNYNVFLERAERSYRFIIRGLPELKLAAVFGSDITDFTRIEADMLRSQNILRKVLDTDPNLIFVKDKLGRFVLVNQAVAEVYGTSVDRLIGKKDSDFNPNAEEVVHFVNDDLDVIRSQNEKLILEESVTDAAGNSRFFSTVKRPLRLSQNEDTFVLGVSTDISAVKRLQEQLAQSSKMEALGQLAGGIAHDFNNLLTAILGYADILKITHASDEQVVKPVSMIQVAADRAKMLTEQLLGFARQGKKQNTTVDMHALMNDTLSLLKRTIDPVIHLETEFLALKPYVCGDPIQLQQVIMNLAINARDAVLTSFNGIVPKIDIKTRNVSEVSGDSKSFLEISFSDNGCGISLEVQNKIFDPFFTTKEVGKGTGLGLSTAYGIIHNHDGEIRVESNVGEGTRFYLRFPTVANNIKAEERRPIKNSPRIVSGTILLVDDHSEVLLVATNMLETLGFKVISCSSGKEAIRELNQSKGRIAAAVVDMMMPGLSGIETIDALKKIEPKLPIVVVSGFAKSDALQEVIRRGYHFLRKPFELDALSEVISDAIASN